MVQDEDGSADAPAGAVAADRGSLARALLLADVTAQLARTMDPDVAVGRLARLLVPAMADWCVVTLVEDDESRPSRRRLRDVGWWHTDPAQRPVVQEYAAHRIAALSEESFLARALRTTEPLQVPRGATGAIQGVLAPGAARDLIARLAPESVTIIPLVSRGRTLGALSLFNGPERGVISSESLATVRDAVANAAVVLDNARLYRRQRVVAETFQRSLLTEPVQPDHVQIVVRYQPAPEAAQVGGDWYDAFMQPDGSAVLVIGDVVGHDIEAAALMAQVRPMLRGIAVVTQEGPAQVLAQLDSALRTLQIPVMATVLVARLEQTEEERGRGVTRLRWSSAGHPPPMVVDADGSVRALVPSSPAPLVGILPESPRGEDVVVLERGATVLLYTDGLVESRTRPLREGLAELEALLRRVGGADLDTLCDVLLAQLAAESAEDDVALVGVRLHLQDRPRPAAAGPNRVPPDVPDAEG
ncbi:serine phosphatase [Xylanimonas oleitrophica]|uniref:Serine phosphatase n=1 Tax=Xylanimonas oleitrophica TaxID=2607479 RepID=A0A2W5WVL7_9MICO|nr:GAF domain-containing SpoIIE family protein phosphatase [Xylanimonas oleitrophica]PZR52326.1 serine phosphatase [Xylanimonas oleitrophica]